MSSRKPEDLHPDILPLFTRFMSDCHEEGIDILVTCTYRSNAEQQQLFDQGRTHPGAIVTNAKPGQSKHNFMIGNKPAAKAFDVVPMRLGKPVWDASDPVWQHIGHIGESCGLSWAGRWVKMKEYPHFELKDS